VANPLALNFDVSNYLIDVDGGPTSSNINIQWNPSSTTAYDSNIMLDFGPVGTPTSTQLDSVPFGVLHNSQDGSAPSDAVSARVDGGGTLRTVYADGSESDSFQLGYIALGASGPQSVVRAPLDSATQTAVNAIFPVVAP
jgi:hypothetical protein